MQLLPNKRKFKKIPFFYLAFSGLYWPKTVKRDKLEENCQNSNHLIKFAKVLVCIYFQINENSYRTQLSNLTNLGQKFQIQIEVEKLKSIEVDSINLDYSLEIQINAFCIILVS